jgi:predicted outer membrane repeat protein
MDRGHRRLTPPGRLGRGKRAIPQPPPRPTTPTHPARPAHCADGSSGMTLRAALAAAASSANASNAITFHPFVVAAGTITLDPTKGPLAGFNQGAGRNLTIEGPAGSPQLLVTTSTASVVVAPANATAVFVSRLSLKGVVFDVSGATALSLDGVEMSGAGKAAARAVTVRSGARLDATSCAFSDFAEGGDGGAIHLSGAARFDGCNFTSNSAGGSDGGGAIFAQQAGFLVISGTTFTSNSATNAGGCIYAGQTTVVISSSTLQGSTADTSTLTAVSSSLTVAGTTFAGNVAPMGSTVVSRSSTATFDRVTFSNNGALTGGALLAQSRSTVTMRSSTLHANSVLGVGEAFYLDSSSFFGESLTVTAPGAIRVIFAVVSTASLVNSIIESDCSSTCFASSGPGASITFSSTLLPPGSGFGAVANNIELANAGLGALANNGGPTQTRLPLFGSPVIDAGDNALVSAGATADQRGLPRISRKKVDLGAVEGECRSRGCVEGMGGAWSQLLDRPL